MTVRLGLLALLVIPACVADEEIELGAYISRAEIHVDPTQPDALAEPAIHLHIDGGVHSHYISIESAWLSLDGGISQPLDLSLDEPAIHIPAGAYLELPLVNGGTRNSDLAALCQSEAPITVWIDMPGLDGGLLAPSRPLSIFCP